MFVSWLCSCSCAHTPPLERVEATEETKLVDLCENEFVGLAKCFTLPDGESMLVKHLKGYMEDTLMAFVGRQNGPEGLVPVWLDDYQLRRYLDGYVSPAVTKKAKGRGDESNLSHSSRTYRELLRKVRGRKSEVSNVDMNTLQDVVAYFSFAEGSLVPRNNGVLAAFSSPLLAMDVRLDTKGNPDLLRLPLPEKFPCQQRAIQVLKLLQDKNVLAAAVSGAGKTRLTFDLAQRRHALYFDMNGGHGKVKQMEVWDFWQRCARVAAEGQKMRRENVVTIFDHVIGALILSRWAALAIALNANSSLSPAEWLWMQTDQTICKRSCWVYFTNLAPLPLC
jgi:hypothetical protein